MKNHTYVIFYIILAVFLNIEGFAQSASGWSSNINEGKGSIYYRFMYSPMDDYSTQMHFGLYQKSLSNNSSYIGMGGLIMSSWESTSVDINWSTGSVSESTSTETSVGLLWGGGYIYEIVEGNPLGNEYLTNLSVGIYGMGMGMSVYGNSLFIPMAGAVAMYPLLGSKVVASGNFSMLLFDGVSPAFGADLIIKPFGPTSKTEFTLGSMLSKLTREGDGGDTPFQFSFGFKYNF